MPWPKVFAGAAPDPVRLMDRPILMGSPVAGPESVVLVLVAAVVPVLAGAVV
jgi:hypothetical protein